MDAIRRQLTPAKRRLVRRHQARLTRNRDLHWQRTALVGIPGFVLLWALTLITSASSVVVVTVFWVLVGGAIIVWIARSEWRPSEAQVKALAQASRDGYAVVTRLECVRYAEVQELEDEGPALILELTGGRLTFLSGQENYTTARFPSSSVEFVQIVNGSGQAVLSLRRCSGAHLAPTRVLDSSFKQVMHWPGDGEIMPGTLDDLDEVLRIDG